MRKMRMYESQAETNYINDMYDMYFSKYESSSIEEKRRGAEVLKQNIKSGRIAGEEGVEFMDKLSALQNIADKLIEDYDYFCDDGTKTRVADRKKMRLDRKLSEYIDNFWELLKATKISLATERKMYGLFSEIDDMIDDYRSNEIDE